LSSKAELKQADKRYLEKRVNELLEQKKIDIRNDYDFSFSTRWHRGKNIETGEINYSKPDDRVLIAAIKAGTVKTKNKSEIIQEFFDANRYRVDVRDICNPESLKAFDEAHRMAHLENVAEYRERMLNLEMQAAFVTDKGYFGDNIEIAELLRDFALAEF